MTAVQQWMNGPCWMESCRSARVMARPDCPFPQEEERAQRACGPLRAATTRPAAGDPAWVRLHLQFVRAHGFPKGAITTFFHTGLRANTTQREGARGK